MTDLPNRPLKIDEFLAFVGWTGPDVLFPQHIAIALAYFQAEVPQQELRRAISNPGMWILPRRGVIKLCELMQSINYTKPVSRELLPRDTVLKAYRQKGEKGHLGNYYTDLGVPSDALAIPRDQTSDSFFFVVTPAPALRCTASDALVHWAEPRGVPAEYRHGGGRQYIVANPRRYLRELQ